jgi:hypothetical protein
VGIVIAATVSAAMKRGIAIVEKFSEGKKMPKTTPQHRAA